MPKRRFPRTISIDQRLKEEASRLRRQALGTAPGIERDQLVRKARQAETAAHMQQWLSSPGLRVPL